MKPKKMMSATATVRGRQRPPQQQRHGKGHDDQAGADPEGVVEALGSLLEQDGLDRGGQIGGRQVGARGDRGSARQRWHVGGDPVAQDRRHDRDAETAGHALHHVGDRGRTRDSCRRRCWPLPSRRRALSCPSPRWCCCCRSRCPCRCCRRCTHRGLEQGLLPRPDAKRSGRPSRAPLLSALRLRAGAPGRLRSTPPHVKNPTAPCPRGHGRRRLSAGDIAASP